MLLFNPFEAGAFVYVKNAVAQAIGNKFKNNGLMFGTTKTLAGNIVS